MVSPRQTMVISIVVCIVIGTSIAPISIIGYDSHPKPLHSNHSHVVPKDDPYTTSSPTMLTLIKTESIISHEIDVLTHMPILCHAFLFNDSRKTHTDEPLGDRVD